MKYMHAIIISLICIILSSCSEKSKHEEVFSDGVVENGVYRHDQIGLSIKIPDKWNTSDFLAIKTAHRSAAEKIRPDDAEFRSSNLEGCYPLLAISKYPLNNPSGHSYNPTLSITATTKEVLAEFREYTLEDKINALKTIEPPCYLVQEGMPFLCGNTMGLHAVVEVRYPQATIRQDVIELETEKFMIDVVVSTIDPADRKVLKDAVNSIKIKL